MAGKPGGAGMLYSKPVIRDGKLHRGVISNDYPAQNVLPYITRDKWVILKCNHGAGPLRITPETDLYQCDPFYDNPSVPTVFAIPREFISERKFRPLGTPKKYDVVFNACWSDTKRPYLMLESLSWAKTHNRSISCLWYGYHWHGANGGGTADYIEAEVKRLSKKKDLGVVFLNTDWNAVNNNKRYNSARLAVLTSHSEAGPRVISEANLAGLPYLCASDVVGGSLAYVRPENKNGKVFQPNPRNIAETIWDVLDHLDEYRPREWALKNMCQSVGIKRMQEALKKLEVQKGWLINWQDVMHDGGLGPFWENELLKADKIGVEVTV